MDDSNRMGRASLVGAMVAAFAASACCLGPALLALVGISGVGFAAALERHRPLLLAVTAVLLGIGFYIAYRRPKIATAASAAGDACVCDRPRGARIGRPLLWITTVLAVGFAAYPYLAGALARRSATGPAAATAGAVTVRIVVDGMSCKSCVSHITAELSKKKGVVRSEVSFSAGIATVQYNPQEVTPAELVKAIEAAGYSARVFDRGKA